MQGLLNGFKAIKLQNTINEEDELCSLLEKVEMRGWIEQWGRLLQTNIDCYRYIESYIENFRSDDEVRYEILNYMNEIKYLVRLYIESPFEEHQMSGYEGTKLNDIYIKLRNDLIEIRGDILDVDREMQYNMDNWDNLSYSTEETIISIIEEWYNITSGIILLVQEMRI